MLSCVCASVGVRCCKQVETPRCWVGAVGYLHGLLAERSVLDDGLHVWLVEARVGQVWP